MLLFLTQATVWVVVPSTVIGNRGEAEAYVREW